jgi:iron(III) transport system substrate-binding protein
MARDRIIAAALLLVTAACGSETSGQPPALAAGACVEQTDESVTIYSGRTENIMAPILDAFACDTGVDVRVRWGASNDLALLLAEEGENTEADVFLSRSPGPVGFLEAKGLLAELEVTTLDLVDEANRAAAGTWVGFSGRKRVLVHNTEQVGADELPESVFDLADEQYRGRVALPATNGSFEDWFTVFRDQFGDDEATQWLDDMVANDARYYPNNRAIVEAVGRGEIDMGLVNHYYNYQESTALGDAHKGENHDLADDDIGSLLIVTAAGVMKASDNKDVAEELIRYLLAENSQTYFTEETFEYPLAAGVEPAAILPPLDALAIGSVDFDALGGGFEATERIIADSGILNQ